MTPEVLFTFKQWDDRDFPCTLLMHASGAMDLHAQTGDGHTAAIIRARRILRKRGYKVGQLEFIGPTGAYYPVIERRSKRKP